MVEWLVKDQLCRKVMEAFVNGEPIPDVCCNSPGGECEDPVECAARLNLSPEMKTAVAILADLRAGRIVCTRIGASDL